MRTSSWFFLPPLHPKTEWFSERVSKAALRGRGGLVFPTCPWLLRVWGSCPSHACGVEEALWWGGGCAPSQIRRQEPVKPSDLLQLGATGRRAAGSVAAALRLAYPAPRGRAGPVRVAGEGGRPVLPWGLLPRASGGCRVLPLRPKLGRRRQVWGCVSLLSCTCCASGKYKQLSDVNRDYPVGGPGPGPNMLVFCFVLFCFFFLVQLGFMSCSEAQFTVQAGGAGGGGRVPAMAAQAGNVHATTTRDRSRSWSPRRRAQGC